MAMGISHGRTNYDLARSIENSLDYRNILVIDELAHLYPTGKASSLQAIEFVRGLHDRTGCGVILVATDGLPQIMAGGKWGQWFEQLLGRVELHLRIPAKFSRREIADLCGAFTDDPSPELIKMAGDIANARKGGIRELMRHLTRASQAATKRNEPMGVNHLVAAYEFSRTLTSTEEE
jgi:DNA transposition AAA+ family ATPase